MLCYVINAIKQPGSGWAETGHVMLPLGVDRYVFFRADADTDY